MSNTLRFVDIGVNLADMMFRGVYNCSKAHDSDITEVINRAFGMGMTKMIITGGSLSESQEALALAKDDERLFLSVGCHPTRCNEFKENQEEYYQSLKKLILNNPFKVVAVGEFGLDYERTKFCDSETQMIFFQKQLKLAYEVKLPMFLHCRAAHKDLVDSMNTFKSKYYNDSTILAGVVHSFDGSLMDAEEIIKLGLHIGINGCSLKTNENLEVVKKLPLDRLLLETDAPWCEIRPTHAGYHYVQTHLQHRKKERWEKGCLVKGRNEPANIVQVLEVLAGVRDEPVNVISQAIYENTMKLFFPNISAPN